MSNPKNSCFIEISQVQGHLINNIISVSKCTKTMSCDLSVLANQTCMCNRVIQVFTS